MRCSADPRRAAFCRRTVRRAAGRVGPKARLGLSPFQAALLIAGASRGHDEITTAAADAARLDPLRRSERHTLRLLTAISVANVVLAVRGRGSR